MQEYFEIGQIVNTHGVKGQVKVNPFTDDLERFEELKSIYIVKNKQLLEFEIEEVKYQKNMLLIKFKDIDDLNMAEKYKGCYLKIHRKDARKLPKDTYFIADIIGSDVITDDGKLLGKEKLKMAQLEKFNKKMEIQRLRTYARGFRDFSTTEEKGIMTTEMEEFIKLLENKPEFAEIAKEVKGIFERVTEQENQNTQLVPKSPKVSIRKQLKSVEQENEMLSGEIRTIKIQDAEIKSKDVAKKIANTRSDALTQFEMVLQNAEKALHIEDERENNRVMQEDLAR